MAGAEYMLKFQKETAQIRLRDRKRSYYEVIHSLEFPECSRALDYVYGKLDMEKIESLLQEIKKRLQT